MKLMESASCLEMPVDEFRTGADAFDGDGLFRLRAVIPLSSVSCPV
ncbi:MAG: hypothetical protein LBG27_07175 [Spirochaetaceae bacterium]|nr:hypothetical protein [Spirochaetaceae bacterium]